MTLPEFFQFSQGSLQDYVDCPRRFQLKYIEQLAWPAVDTEPALENEQFLQLGAAFHRLVQQYLIGVPSEKLTRLAERDIQLAHWWENFLAEARKMDDWKAGQLYPEISLSAPLSDFRLVGKFDLLTANANKFIIYDWKTSRKQPKREWIAANLQTRVYPYLLACAGTHLNAGKSIEPAQIEMIYWFANFPATPLHFPYSEAQHQADEEFIGGLIVEIRALSAEPAPLTENEKRCHYCVYRSLCNRGIAAGPLESLEEDRTADMFDFDLDFEQIAEIEF